MNQQDTVVLKYLLQLKAPGFTQHQLIEHVLRGAYVSVQDGGILYTTWQQDIGGKPTHSSHASVGTQYSITAPLVRVLLYGKSKVGSWFQMERYDTSLSGIALHMATWLEYRRTGLNQGPYGSTSYREAQPIVASSV